MTGPEHYLDAESLLREADNLLDQDVPNVYEDTQRQVLALGTLAHAHATLALAAAQAEAHPRQEWREVTST